MAKCGESFQSSATIGADLDNIPERIANAKRMAQASANALCPNNCPAQLVRDISIDVKLVGSSFEITYVGEFSCGTKRKTCCDILRQALRDVVLNAVADGAPEPDVHKEAARPVKFPSADEIGVSR